MKWSGNNYGTHCLSKTFGKNHVHFACRKNILVKCFYLLVILPIYKSMNLWPLHIRDARFVQELSKCCYTSLANSTGLLLVVQKMASQWERLYTQIFCELLSYLDGMGCSELGKSTIFLDHPVVRTISALYQSLCNPLLSLEVHAWL